MPPKISVITVCWNCAGAIEETIRSVLSQTYDRVEYLVVDGKSTDGTLEILKKYAHAIDVLVSEADNGIYDAMNKGLALLSGDSDYVLFLNAGDTFAAEDTIARVVAARYSSKSHVYGDVLTIDGRKSHPARLSIRVLASGMICHQSLFFRSQIHRQTPYDTKYKISADFDLLVRMFRRGDEFEHVDVDVARFDATGVSSKQRQTLHQERREIIASYPLLKMWFVTRRFRTALRRLKTMVCSGCK